MSKENQIMADVDGGLTRITPLSDRTQGFGYLLDLSHTEVERDWLV